MRGITPDSVRARPRKSYFDQIRTRSLSGPDLELVRMLLGPDARLGAWLAPGVLQRITDGPIAPSGAMAWSGQAFDLAVLEAWLRFQEDQDSTARLLNGRNPLVTVARWS